MTGHSDSNDLTVSKPTPSVYGDVVKWYHDRLSICYCGFDSRRYRFLGVVNTTGKGDKSPNAMLVSLTSAGHEFVEVSRDNTLF